MTDTDGISMRFGFLRDGCESLARNVTDLLTLAGQPVTADAILAVVRTLPIRRTDFDNDGWKSLPCALALERARVNVRGTLHERRFIELAYYFEEYLPGRSYMALDLLNSAFMGVLGNLNLED